MKISNKYIEIARNEKDQFNLDFKKEPKVAAFYDICQVFGKNKLLEYKKSQDRVMKSEQGQNWLEKLIDLINSTNENCQRIKQLAIKLNDEEA